jgi:hypothetical protein
MIGELPRASPNGDLPAAALSLTRAELDVHVELPGGRVRELHVLEVAPAPSYGPIAERVA